MKIIDKLTLGVKKWLDSAKKSSWQSVDILWLNLTKKPLTTVHKSCKILELMNNYQKRL